MTSLVWDSATGLLDLWKTKVEAAGGIADLHIDQDLLDFSGDVISKASLFWEQILQGKRHLLQAQ